MEHIRGIVLRTVKYGENGIIVDLLTDRHGRMSLSTVRTGHAKGRFRSKGTSHLMPLSLVEFECDIHGQGKLPRPRYIAVYHHYESLQQHPMKVMLSMFLSEFLIQAMREVSTDTRLYDYLEYSLRWLDETRRPFANFHIVFLIKLTRFIGIYPAVDHGQRGLYYDLMRSEFCESQPLHAYFLHPTEACTLRYMLGMSFENMHLYRLSRQQRHRCLEVLNDYYRLHLPGFGELRSINILHDVFD